MEILDIFKKIASIAHCSGDTAKLQNFIVEFAKKFGFQVEIDRAANILCYKSKREICLQSHYDMVCIGKAPDIKIVQKNGFLMAKESSLGADNGIGLAIMLSLIKEGVEAEYLFTNDEEVGLIGASNIKLKIKAKKMINLDSEEFGSIYVGCAGGADIVATKKINYKKSNKKYFYKVISKNFPGGHSGVDIDKNISNAIKEFSFFIKEGEIGKIEAGERRNSIPVRLDAFVATDKKIDSSENFEVIEVEYFDVIDFDLITFLLSFANGVRGWEKEFDIPLMSMNLAKVDISDSTIKIEASLRANRDNLLDRLKKEYEAFFKLSDFEAKIEGEYPAWEPKVTPLAKKIKKIYKKYFGDISYKAIHAGLESSLFAKKYPDLEIISIGPTIENPHSVSERVKISTIEPIYNIVKQILID